jgi:3-hydroxymyristoyl/3-hydroxydecanoyl-(acyl carrier protein) dehydratase
VGLDAGKRVATLIEQQATPPAAVHRVAPHEVDGGGLRRGSGKLRMLDQADIVRDGGRFGQGYVHGSRRVAEDDWYFSCHFHRDPVMPGSLGVEAVLQAMQLYVIDSGLARELDDPCFAMAPGVEMRWKYRGQILRADPELELEVHIKEVREEQTGLIVIGDASLWKKGGLRIYELQDVAIMVRDRDKSGEGR